MTKVSVFGQPEKESKELKKIEFVKRCPRGDFMDCSKHHRPKDMSEIVLLEKRYTDDMDLMWCKNEGTCWVLFLGKWNDGVV